VSNTMKFACVFLVVNLHLLRNFAPVPYFLVYGAVSGAMIASFALGGRRREIALALPAMWLLVGIGGTAASLVLIPWTAALYGATRFFFVAPVFLALVQFTDSRTQLLANVRTMTIFFAGAALTIPLQFLIGPISWFAAGSERGGYERFGSLVGSLTSLGIVTGSYIVLMQLSSPKLRVLQISVTILCAFASLSKAAIANVAISLVVSIRENRGRAFKGVGALSLAGALTAASVAYIAPVNERFDATLASFGVNVGGAKPANFDTSVQQSAIERVSLLPKENFRALRDWHSPMVYLTGGGFAMASTALVPATASDAPMSHNQYTELVTVFGPFGGGLMIAVMIAVLVRLKRRAQSPMDIPSVVMASFSIFLLNSLFANGTVYQPASGSILCLAAYVAVAPLRCLFEVEEGIGSAGGFRLHSQAKLGAV
jgi:O-antigen ligase